MMLHFIHVLDESANLRVSKKGWMYFLLRSLHKVCLAFLRTILVVKMNSK